MHAAMITLEAQAGHGLHEFFVGYLIIKHCVNVSG